MAKVKLEIVPWLSVAWEETAKGRLVVEEEVVPGETLGSLLRRLAEGHPRFGEYVFDIKRGRVAGFASIVINDDALGRAPDLGRELKEGDTIVFLPPYVGGALPAMASLLEWTAAPLDRLGTAPWGGETIKA